jgi:hypothetical protein
MHSLLQLIKLLQRIKLLQLLKLIKLLQRIKLLQLLKLIKLLQRIKLLQLLKLLSNLLIGTKEKGALSAFFYACLFFYGCCKRKSVRIKLILR